jgi:endonuclease-8
VPEGPEIRIEAEQIRAAVGGRVARSVFFAFRRLKRFQNVLAGNRIASVRARGKAILIGFDSGHTVYSHNQLYGKWVICANGQAPDTSRQLRVAIHGPRKSALLYSASEVAVIDSSRLDEHPYLSRLGPDILNGRVTDRRIVSRFEDPAFSKRTLASLFLDQHFLAGVGNYLRSEILFAAGVHPRRRPQQLSSAETLKLSRATRKLMKQSLSTRGVTNDLARARKLKSAGWSRDEYRFAVFARADRPCFVCGGRIERHSIAGRRCYFCPNCQPL